jgi:hypothetical protein
MSDAIRPTEERSLYFAGALAAILQLVAIGTYTVAGIVLGPRPETSAEFFQIYAESPAAAILRNDALLVVLISLYLVTFPAIWMALRDRARVWAGMATLFTIVAVVGAVATESSLALARLARMYVVAGDEAIRMSLLATGDAVIAMDMWNGTAAYAGGILLQGSGVLMSALMLRSRTFLRVTGIAGIVGNGLDLVQHILHLALPGVQELFAPVMGIFYLAWYVLVARDLLVAARSRIAPGSTEQTAGGDG